jgi:predicted nucleotidyltransferase
MRRRSLSSVKIISIDATEVRRHVDDYARELLARRPEVEEIIVFGSFENDTYAPASDIDLFLVLCEANDSTRDRIPQFLPDKSLGVPVDVFPFTRAEIAQLSESPLLAAVNKSRWRYRR